MRKLFFLLITTSVILTGCSKYDDSDIKKQIDDLDGRLTKIETLCDQFNTDMTTITKLVSALEDSVIIYKNQVAVMGKKYVTAVTSFSDSGNGGYSIKFSDGSYIYIYNGSNGKDGHNGSDGSTPIISIQKNDTDGFYYWTVNGELMKDAFGNSIRANGVTPQIRMESSTWQISLNDGLTWENLWTVENAEGESFIRGVVDGDGYVSITLLDGTSIDLPKYQSLKVTFTEGNSLAFLPNESKTLNYVISGGNENNLIVAQLYSSTGDYSITQTPTDAYNGTITIQAGDSPTANKVVVWVSDGTQTIMTAINLSLDDRDVRTVERFAAAFFVDAVFQGQQQTLEPTYYNVTVANAAAPLTTYSTIVGQTIAEWGDNTTFRYDLATDGQYLSIAKRDGTSNVWAVMDVNLTDYPNIKKIYFLTATE